MATCCPDVYHCPSSGDSECPRHSGFTVCCNQTDKHVLLQDRASWHADQEAEERALLDQWIRINLITVTAEPDPVRVPAGGTR
ncbi:hypothetical protein ACIQVL_48575 [Streptomyces sp. NPDC090499]|uniref:hypothetical protein n=1 Tax=Streptomyces sp. NPDC090499 TaxID=3365965 RepID=UPI0038291728